MEIEKAIVMVLFQLIQLVETTYRKWQDFQFQPMFYKLLYHFLAIPEKIHLNKD